MKGYLFQDPNTSKLHVTLPTLITRTTKHEYLAFALCALQHLDYVWGKNAAELVYDKVVALLQEHDPTGSA